MVKKFSGILILVLIALSMTACASGGKALGEDEFSIYEDGKKIATPGEEDIDESINFYSAQKGIDLYTGKDAVSILKGKVLETKKR